MPQPFIETLALQTTPLRGIDSSLRGIGSLGNFLEANRPGIASGEIRQRALISF
jgi:hypothetical protein